MYIYMNVSETFQIDSIVTENNNNNKKKIGPIYSIGFFLFFVHKIHFTMGDRIFAS